MRWFLTAAVLTAACAGRGQSTPPELGRVLDPIETTIQIAPGAEGELHFLLRTPSGVPVPGEAVTFTIVDDPDVPGAEAQGAVLVDTTVVTDGMGIARAEIVSGTFTVFQVRADEGDAEAEAEVVVAAGMLGTVQVAPFYPPGSRAASSAATVEVLFFSGDACASIPLRDPPMPVRTVRTLPPSGGVATYQFVETTRSDAVVGRALDGRGALQALGCVDLPGAALIDGGTVQLALPLADASPDPVGVFAATSNLPLSPAPPAAMALSAPWRDLADCPLDPAQLWLDCTIDALSGPATGDPVDCEPATEPGAEGPLGDALAPHRGTWLAGADGQPTPCRGARDASGASSADAVLMGLFGSPLPPAVVELGPIADDAGHLLDVVTVRSTLEVRPGARDGVYQVTHTLDNVVFGAPGAQQEVPLLPLGLPALAATTTATISDGALVIASHGMTLHLGSAARVAFGTLGLAQRALPADAAGFVASLAALARSPDGTQAGCAALDSALCAQAGQAAGCLRAACATGLIALAARLDGAFDAANGDGLDLTLSGSAPLLDPHGNGSADRLGDFEASPPAPGIWSVDLRMRASRTTIMVPWAAVRTGN